MAKWLSVLAQVVKVRVPSEVVLPPPVKPVHPLSVSAAAAIAAAEPRIRLVVMVRLSCR